MKYEIQFNNDGVEHWVDYAETNFLAYAQEIADNLLKSGKHRARINRFETTFIIGDILGKKLN